MKARISKFVEERDAALFSLDRPTIEAYFKKRGMKLPENETVFWAGVYKSICNITSAPPELVEKAKKWLHAHGMSEKISFPAYHYN